MPADPRLNEEIVLQGAETADLAEWNPKTGGTNTGSFRQDFTEIAFAQSVAAEFRRAPCWRRSRLIPASLSSVGSGNVPLLGEGLFSTENPFGNGRDASPVLAICSTIFRAQTMSSGR